MMGKPIVFIRLSRVSITEGSKIKLVKNDSLKKGVLENKNFAYKRNWVIAMMTNWKKTKYQDLRNYIRIHTIT